MPRFVVDLERLKYLHCGLGQFSLHFGQAIIAATPNGWDPALLLPPHAQFPFGSRSIRTLTAHVWRKEQVHRWIRPFSRLWRPSSYDLWHVTHQDSRYWPLDPRVPVVLTIHDLNFLRTKSPRVIRRRLRLLQKKIDRATVLATGSAHAAREIREHFRVDSKRLRVIPNGVCLNLSVAPRKPADVSDDAPFLFTIGDIRPSKNFQVLVDMLVHLPHRLIIAGSTHDPYASALEHRAAELGLSDRVQLVGRVTDAERLWLYQHCEALVFPSLAEGFGLPVIEAMHCGRPVFSSRCTSLPEVGGPLAFYWDNFDPDAMATIVRDGLQQFAADHGYPDQLRAWTKQFTWSRTADRYLELYRDVLSKRESGFCPAA